MAVASPLGLRLPLIVFLLVPGYLALRGYFSSTVQIDTTTRIDKLLLGIVGGSLSLGTMLLLNRFGIFWYAIQKWYSLFDHSIDMPAVRFSSEYALRTSATLDTTFLAAFGFLFVQSGLAYFGAYLYGTFVHIRSDIPRKADKNLQQPWQTALRQSIIGDGVSVVTKNGDKISGELYRIGSPSESYDLLLSAAEQVTSENKDNDLLGMTYHNQDDISHVEFDFKRRESSSEKNWVIRFLKVCSENIGSNIATKVPSRSRILEEIANMILGTSSVARCLRKLIWVRIYTSGNVEETISEAHRTAQHLRRLIENQ